MHRFANCALPHGLSQDVTRGDVDFTGVLLVAEVLLDLDKVSHVIVG